MRKKILEALIEGNFIFKALQSIKKKLLSAPRVFREFLDLKIGNICRAILAYKTPINEKKIMFLTFQGDYTCNPKYITEKLIFNKIDCEIIWAVNLTSYNSPEDFPPCVKLVQMDSYEYYKQLASAKIWIANSVEFLKKPILKKKGQYFIETWHGSLGIKKFDKKNNHGQAWVKAAIHSGKIADYIISNSRFENHVYRNTYWEKTEILELGHPRNDILIEDTDDIHKKIKLDLIEKFALSPEVKIVLYAPTFRDSKSHSCYNINIEKILNSLRNRFSGEWVFITRLHPTVRKKSTKYINTLNTECIDATEHPDMQELLLLADVAITDYSSWIYDFLLTGKPGFIFATDIKQYNNERGFYYPLEATPFSVSTNNNQLAKNILAFNEKEYLEKVKIFLEDKGCFENGHASQKIVDKICELFNN